MKIEREKPCQRRHHRLTAPLLVRFDDRKQVMASDWSLGGIGLSWTDSKLPKVGDEFEFTLTIAFQGYNISFDARTKVVRVSGDGKIVGFEFVNLSERSSDLLNYFSEDLIRGKMGTIEDSICRIDVPVTPISTEPSKNHITETPLQRLPIKTILMSTMYICLGLFVFSYLGILIYSNVMKLEIPSSVVSTELKTLKMPVDGIIRPINFEVGAYVEQGESLAIIEDYKLENDINNAKANIEVAQKSIWRMEQKVKIEEERLKLYQLVSETDKNIAKARLVALQEALKAADAHFVRISELNKSGNVTNSQFESAKNNQAKAAAAVSEAEYILQKNSAMETASDRRHYNHKEFVTDLDMLSVDLEMVYSQLELEIKKLEQLEERKNKLVLRAPFDGRVMNLYQTAYNRVGQDDPVLLLEKANDISVTSYLTQKEILSVGLYDQAKVFIPALNKHIPAKITRIDRHSLYLNKEATNYTWRNDDERTASVILKLEVSKDIAEYITAGLPVVTIFNRTSNDPIWSDFLNILPQNKNNANKDFRYEKI